MAQDVVMRYFFVDDLAFDASVLAKIQERAEHADKWAAFARAHKAASAQTWQHDGSFAGFKFPIGSQPCTETYKRIGELWVPMRSKPKGKAVWKLVRELPLPVNPNDTLSEFGINWKIPTLTSKGEALFACVVGHVDKPGWFVKVPSRHFSAAQLEEFRIAGTSGEGKTTSPLWQPPAAWLEISEWAFMDQFHEQATS